MQTISNIRKVTEQDLPGLKTVLDSSELFPAEYLDGMIYDFLHNPESEEVWFTKLLQGKVVALGFCAPEKLTEGTYNLYAIAVHKELQGQGIGQEMMAYIEALLKETGKRILIVETSSAPHYALTRKFYEKLGYVQEATIRDFWQENEHKVIFWKKLQA